MSHRENQIAADQAASVKYHSVATPSVTISQPQDDQYLVNGKLLYLDSNNKWITTDELTYKERQAFRKELHNAKDG